MGTIKFVPDGNGRAPSYSVKVSDGDFESEFYPATIQFQLNFIPYAVGGGVAAGIAVCAATSIAAAVGVGFFVKRHMNSKKIISNRKRTRPSTNK